MGSKCCKCGSDNVKHHNGFISTSSSSTYKRTRGNQRALSERFHSTESGDSVELRVDRVTADDGGTYWAMASNAWGDSRAEVTLEVDPQAPAAPAFLRRLTDLAVKVGTRTRFLVEIRSPSEVRVLWMKDGLTISEGERFHLLNEGNFFCIDVAPVTLDDSGRWTCLAQNVAGRTTCSCELNVLVPKAYKKPEFVEELQALLTAQGTVSLECKVVGVPTPTLRWFKDDKEIKAGDVFALTADPNDATSLGTYTCEATNCMGQASSTSKVHLMGTSREGSLQPADSLLPSGPAPIFSKQLRNEKVKIGNTLILECVVNVPPWPKTINWYNKEGEVTEGERYHIMADGLGSYSICINPLEASDEGLWKCVATSNTGVKAYSTCEVQMAYPKNYRKPKFLESLKAILTEEGLVSFECKVVGYPTPNLSWFKDGQELKPGDVYQLTGTNSLGTYCCIARNCMGEARSTAELTVEDIQSQLSAEERLQLFSGSHPPRFIQGLKSMEAKISDRLKFTVKVSVSPEPVVLWFREDEQIDESEKYQLEKEALGVYHLTVCKLEFADQAEWKCVATNDYGQSITSCFVRLNIPKHYKKPKFLENLRAVLSEEGAVNLECKVIGVPQPVLKWYKDGKELKPGDIHRIISGQDGTCCLGTYTCEAHNCMGTASSSASLLGFEERGHGKVSDTSKAPASHAPLARDPSLSTIHEERTSQMHDTERSLTIDERAEEISFSFDGKEVSVSLYETPDLTEEEALQIVEMYADQLSEHVSEHNIVELPPMRFVKETSTSGNLMMEAVVIDVSQDYFSAAEDDLRTDADLEEFSFVEEAGLAGQTPDDEGLALDKLNSDFLERALATAIPYDMVEPPPIKPPRKKSGVASKSPDSKMSGEEDVSGQFTDAVASSEEKESFRSAQGSSKDKSLEKAQSKKIKEEKLAEKKTARSRSSSMEKSRRSSDESFAEGMRVTEAKARRKTASRKKSTDSEKEDDSLREFEKRKYLEKAAEAKSRKRSDSEKEDDSLYEFESRKNNEEYPKAVSDEKLNLSKIELDESTKTTTENTSANGQRQKTSEGPYPSDLMDENASIGVYEKEVLEKGPKKKKKGTKKAEGEDILASDESLAPNKKTSSKAEQKLTDEDQSIDYESAEAFDKSEISVLESLTQSLQEIQKGLALVEARVVTESGDEMHSAKSSISVIESLVQPINDIQKGIETVELQITEECASGRYSPTKAGIAILETLAQPIGEFQRNLAIVEQQSVLQGTGESLFERTNQTILETVAQPLQDINRDIALIQQQSVVGEADSTSLMKLENMKEFFSDLQSVQESIVGKLEELDKKLEEPVYAQSVQELQQGLAKIVETQSIISGKVSSTDETLTTSSQTTETDRKKTFTKSLSIELRELEENANEDLSEFFDRLMNCAKTLRLKADDESDLEISTILKSICNLVNPLRNLTGITSKCISVIVDDYEALGIDAGIPSSTFIESLTKPLEALKISLQLLEQVASYNSSKEIRGIGIPILYKIKGPMNELETTIKLVENLSAHTAMEFLSQPLSNLSSAITSIEPSKSEEGFAENLKEDSVVILRNLDDSLEIMMNCINSIDKYIPQMSYPSGNLTKLTPLYRPMEEFFKHLHAIENIISRKADENNLSCPELNQLAHEMSKPLELMRMELSILQHQIEVDHFGEISAGKEVSKMSEAMYSLTSSLDAMQSSISTLHDSIIAKPPEEPVYLRYMLYSLKELTQPLNELCSHIMRAEESILPHSSSRADPFVGLKSVTKTVHDLQEASKAIKQFVFVTASESNPAMGIAHAISSTIIKPLDLVQSGLVDIIEQIHDKDKHDLNLNLLKTMSEPFDVLQKALIQINEKLMTENIPEIGVAKLKQAIQELQRSILVIQDQTSFEYGGEPSTVESNIETLESLVQPLLTLKVEFTKIQKSISHEIPKSQKQAVGFNIVEGVAESIHKMYDDVTELLVNSKLHEGDEAISKLLKVVECAVLSFEENVTKAKQDNSIKDLKQAIVNGLEDSSIELNALFGYVKKNKQNLSLEQVKAVAQFENLVESLKPTVQNSIKLISHDFAESVNVSQEVGLAFGKLTEIIEDFGKLTQSNKIQREREPIEELICKLEDQIYELKTDESLSPSVKLVVESIVKNVDHLKECPSSKPTEKSESETLASVLLSVDEDLAKVSSLMGEKNESVLEAQKLVLAINGLQKEPLQLTFQKQTVPQQGRAEEFMLPQNVEQKVQGIVREITALNECVDQLKNTLDISDKKCISLVETLSNDINIIKEITSNIEMVNAVEKEHILEKLSEPAIKIQQDIKTLQVADVTVSDTTEFHEALVAVEKISDLLNNKDKAVAKEVQHPQQEAFSELDVSLFWFNEVESLKKDAPTIKILVASINYMKENSKIDDESSKMFLNNIKDYEDSLMTLVSSVLSLTESKDSFQLFQNEIKSKLTAMKTSLSAVEKEGKEQHGSLEKIKAISFALENSLLPQQPNDISLKVLPLFQALFKELKMLHEKLKVPEVETPQLEPEMEVKHSEQKYLEQFAKVSQDLELGLMKVERALLQTEPGKAKLDNIEDLAGPANILCNCIDSVNSNPLFEKIDSNEDSTISLLKTLAQPIREIHKAVAEMQDVVVLESSGKVGGKSECSDLLHAIAKPIRELRHNIALIQDQALIMSADVSTLTAEQLSSKTVAVPLLELKEAVASLVHGLFVEQTDSSFTSENLALLKALATPLQEIHEQLLNIDQQQILEAGLTCSVQEKLNEIAMPVYELHKELATIEQQEVLAAPQGKSEGGFLPTLALPLLEACKHVAEVIQQNFVEGLQSDKTIMSDLPTLASATDVSPEMGQANVLEFDIHQDEMSYASEVVSLSDTLVPGDLSIHETSEVASQETVSGGILEVVGKEENLQEHLVEEFVSSKVQEEVAKPSITRKDSSQIGVEMKEILLQSEKFSVEGSPKPHTAQIKDSREKSDNEVAIVLQKESINEQTSSNSEEIASLSSLTLNEQHVSTKIEPTQICAVQESNEEVSNIQELHLMKDLSECAEIQSSSLSEKVPLQQSLIVQLEKELALTAEELDKADAELKLSDSLNTASLGNITTVHEHKITAEESKDENWDLEESSVASVKVADEGKMLKLINHEKEEVSIAQVGEEASKEKEKTELKTSKDEQIGEKASSMQKVDDNITLEELKLQEEEKEMTLDIKKKNKIKKSEEIIKPKEENKEIEKEKEILKEKDKEEKITEELKEKPIEKKTKELQEKISEKRVDERIEKPAEEKADKVKEKSPDKKIEKNSSKNEAVLVKKEPAANKLEERHEKTVEKIEDQVKETEKKVEAVIEEPSKKVPIELKEKSPEKKAKEVEETENIEEVKEKITDRKIEDKPAENMAEETKEKPSKKTKDLNKIMPEEKCTDEKSTDKMAEPVKEKSPEDKAGKGKEKTNKKEADEVGADTELREVKHEASKKKEEEVKGKSQEKKVEDEKEKTTKKVDEIKAEQKVEEVNAGKKEEKTKNKPKAEVTETEKRGNETKGKSPEKKDEAKDKATKKKTEDKKEKSPVKKIEEAKGKESEKKPEEVKEKSSENKVEETKAKVTKKKPEEVKEKSPEKKVEEVKGKEAEKKGEEMKEKSPEKKDEEAKDKATKETEEVIEKSPEKKVEEVKGKEVKKKVEEMKEKSPEKKDEEAKDKATKKKTADKKEKSPEKKVEETKAKVTKKKPEEVKEKSPEKKVEEVKGKEAEKKAEEMKEKSTEKKGEGAKDKATKKKPEEVKEKSPEKKIEEAKGKEAERKAEEMKEKSPEKKDEEAKDKTTKKKAEDKKEKSPEKKVEETKAKVTKKKTEDVKEKSPEKKVEEAKDKATKKKAEEVKEKSPEKKVEEAKGKEAEKKPEEVKEKLSEKKVEEIKGKEAEKMAEEMKEKSPEKKVEETKAKVTKKKTEDVKEKSPEKKVEEAKGKEAEKKPEEMKEKSLEKKVEDVKGKEAGKKTEEVKEKLSENKIEETKATKKKTHDVKEKSPEKKAEEAAGKEAEKKPEEVKEKSPEKKFEEKKAKVTKKKAEDVKEKLLEKKVEEAEKKPEEVKEKSPEKKVEGTKDKLDDKKAEKVKGQSSEEKVEEVKAEIIKKKAEDMKEKSLEKKVEEAAGKVTEKKVEDVKEEKIDETKVKSPEKKAEDVKEKSSEEKGEESKAKAAHKKAEELKEKSPEKKGEDAREKATEKKAEELKEKSPEKKADETKTRVTKKKTEDVKEKSPEKKVEEAKGKEAEKKAEEVNEKPPEMKVEESKEKATKKKTEEIKEKSPEKKVEGEMGKLAEKKGEDVNQKSPEDKVEGAKAKVTKKKIKDTKEKSPEKKVEEVIGSVAEKNAEETKEKLSAKQGEESKEKEAQKRAEEVKEKAPEKKVEVKAEIAENKAEEVSAKKKANADKKVEGIKDKKKQEGVTAAMKSEEVKVEQKEEEVKEITSKNEVQVVKAMPVEEKVVDVEEKSINSKKKLDSDKGGQLISESKVNGIENEQVVQEKKVVTESVESNATGIKQKEVVGKKEEMIIREGEEKLEKKGNVTTGKKKASVKKSETPEVLIKTETSEEKSAARKLSSTKDGKSSDAQLTVVNGHTKETDQSLLNYSASCKTETKVNVFGNKKEISQEEDHFTKQTLVDDTDSRHIITSYNSGQDSDLSPLSSSSLIQKSRGIETEDYTSKRNLEEGLSSSKPSFCSRLVDRTVVEGSTIKMTCSVLGDPEPTVEWLKDGFPISSKSGDSMFNRYKARIANGIANLEITKVSLCDAGQITCVAKNSKGQVSSTAALKIFADYEPAPLAPVFTKAIKETYKFKEDELHLECKVRGHPTPSVSWLRDGKPLSISGRLQQAELVDGICRLIISNPEPSDAGCYTCKAENSLCSEQVSNYVHFGGREEYSVSKDKLSLSQQTLHSKKPQLNSILTDHLVPTGGTIALHVHVSGTPKPEITWMRGNEILPKKSSRLHYFEDSGVHTLLVSDATPLESGAYTCRAINSYGHVDTTAHIEIVPHGVIKNGKPAMFATRPETLMMISSGEDITFAFHVNGDPKPQVSWMKGVTDITNSGRTMKETFGDYVRLTLKRATAMDAGTYFLLAKNIYGTDRAFVTVRVRERARSLTPTSSWDVRDTATILKDIHESAQAPQKGRLGTNQCLILVARDAINLFK